MNNRELLQALTTKGAKHNLQFPVAIREEFERECGFTDEELEILRLRARGKSLEQIAQAQHCSRETICNRIKNIKAKIAEVVELHVSCT